MYKLFATNHRPGAMGDEFTAETHTEQAAHNLARNAYCGIYTIVSPDGVSTVWESDGTIEGTVAN